MDEKQLKIYESKKTHLISQTLSVNEWEIILKLIEEKIQTEPIYTPFFLDLKRWLGI